MRGLRNAEDPDDGENGLNQTCGMGNNDWRKNDVCVSW